MTVGETDTYNLSINPMGYSGEVSTRCQWSTTVPGGTSCSVSPSVVNLEGTHAANIVVKVATKSRSMAPVLRQPPHGPGCYPVSHLVMSLLALAAVASLQTRRQRATVTLASLLLLVGLWIACGGTAPSPLPVTGTSAGTYSLSAVGTTTIGSGANTTYVTRSIALTLEVK